MIKAPKRYLVRDYMQWPDELRCELINGEIFDIIPAPSLDHQRTVGSLYVALRDATAHRVTNKAKIDCEEFMAPVDVVLSEDTVVQPDLAVVCDSEKLASGKCVYGSPDVVVEVLSPGTALKEKREKLRLYANAGVREYLIIDNHEQYAEYYRHRGNRSFGAPIILGAEDRLSLLGVSELIPTLHDILGWPLKASPLPPTEV